MKSNTGRDAGECSVKSMDPKRIGSTLISESLLDADEAEEASNPAPEILTDRANEEG